MNKWEKDMKENEVVVQQGEDGYKIWECSRSGYHVEFPSGCWHYGKETLDDARNHLAALLAGNLETRLARDAQNADLKYWRSLEE